MQYFRKSLLYFRVMVNALKKNPSLDTLGLSIIDFPLWMKFQNPEKNSIKDRSPWMAFAAIRHLNKLTTKDARVYEWGSGGSTLYFADRVKEIISVEHDKEWFQMISGLLETEKSKNTTYKCILPQPESNYNPEKKSDPTACISEDADYTGMSFKEYVSDISQYPDESFDIVVVDGRARPSCLYHALGKVKKGGHLILDNSERLHYNKIEPLQDSSIWESRSFWGPIPYAPDFSRTTFYKKL